MLQSLKTRARYQVVICALHVQATGCTSLSSARQARRRNSMDLRLDGATGSNVSGLCAFFVLYARCSTQLGMPRMPSGHTFVARAAFMKTRRFLFCSLLLRSSTRGTFTLSRFSCGKRITPSLFAWLCLRAWSSASTCFLRLQSLLRCFRWGRCSRSTGIRLRANSVALPIQEYIQVIRTVYATHSNCQYRGFSRRHVLLGALRGF